MTTPRRTTGQDAALARAAATCLHRASKQATRVLTRHYDAALTPAGCTIEQFTLLTAAAVMGTPSIGALASELGQDPATTSRAVGTLARRGLVTTTADPQDRRTRAVELTPDGREVLTEALPRWRAAQAVVVAALGDDTDALRGRLGDLVDDLG